MIGPPGAGKTTVGKALAKKLLCNFADTDRLIEGKAGRKISEIFVESGEQLFRNLESEVLKESLNDFDGVLALGGGAPISSENQALIDSTNSSVVF